MPRCKECNEKFHQYEFNNKYCKKIDCQTAKGMFKLGKIKEKQKKDRDNAWKKEKAEIKFEIATPGDIAKTLQAPLNLIARLIDKDHPCGMCGRPIKKTFGCHYHSVGSSPTIRFNLLNIWAGCYSCNGNKGGNIPGYDVQLVKMYGKKKWEFIKFDLVRETKPLNLSKEEMRELAVEARRIVRELEKGNLIYPVKMLVTTKFYTRYDSGNFNIRSPSA